MTSSCNPPVGCDIFSKECVLCHKIVWLNCVSAVTGEGDNDLIADEIKTAESDSDKHPPWFFKVSRLGNSSNTLKGDWYDLR